MTIIRGANLLKGNDRTSAQTAVEGFNPVFKIKVNDTISWINQDISPWQIYSLPYDRTSNLEQGKNFGTVMYTDSGINCSFTKPGGYHYTIESVVNDFNYQPFRGTIIVEQ